MASVRASAIPLRWFGEAYGHFTSVYRSVRTYQVIASRRDHDVGSPVSRSKASPLRAAAISSERNEAAWAATLNDFFHCLPSSVQGTR